MLDLLSMLEVATVQMEVNWERDDDHRDLHHPWHG